MTHHTVIGDHDLIRELHKCRGGLCCHNLRDSVRNSGDGYLLIPALFHSGGYKRSLRLLGDDRYIDCDWLVCCNSLHDGVRNTFDDDPWDVLDI